MPVLKKHHGKHIDKKLKFRLRLYFVISLILIGVVFYEILTGQVTPILSAIGMGIGLFIGIIAARMFNLSWDKDAKQVISRLDVFGGVILVLYIFISIFRGKILGEFVETSFITGTSLSIVAGVMIGRVFGTGRKIIAILQEQQLL